MPIARKSPELEPAERLESWKEIAAYLNCSERTAKRWEKTRALPVRRLPGGSAGVFAYRPEIALWRDGDGALPETAPEPGVGPLDVTTHQPHGNQRLPSTGLKRWPLLFAAALLLTLSLAGAVHALRSRRPIAAKVTAHVPPQQAQDLYLKGRFYWNKRTSPDLEEAMRDFRAASDLDPNYAAPYAGMADVYALEPQFGSAPPAVAFPKMLEFARRALALDPDLPEGHRALAFGLFYWDWDRAGSRREFQRAIELGPHDATTLHWYANALQQSQHVQDALPLIERAREMEPTDRSILSDRASILAYVGRKAEANEAWDAIEASEPTYLPPHWHRSEVAFHNGQSEVYLAELKAISAITHSSEDLRRWRTGVDAFRRGGWEAVLNAEADLAVEHARLHGVAYYGAASALDEASRENEALELAELAFQHRDPGFLLISNSDHFEGLKGNPRFEELKARSLLPYPEASATR